MITAILLLAQPAPPACVEERKAISEAAAAIETDYVLADVAERAADAIRTSLAAGQFDRHCKDPKAFADDATKKLRAILQDGHVFLDHAPESRKAGEYDWIEAWRNGAAANGFGVRQVERLKDKIAYLHLTGFYELEPAKAALAAAFELVKDSEGLILDLRNNPGGSDETEWPVQWTFMEKGSALPLHRENREGKLSDSSEPELPWVRYGSSRPLAILVDKSTFSAPEAVAYSLQAQGRAKIFGAPSGGGAHMLGEAVRLTGGWQVVIPEVRPYSPYTGGNWEGTGVIPDVRATRENARTEAAAWIREQVKEKGAVSEPETTP
ncbi:MAG: S41 family peptidase [Pseudomonadota bacterium]